LSVVWPRSSPCACAASTGLDFTPHVDCGDYVIVINADKVKLTGRKKDQKVYYHHTGFIGRHQGTFRQVHSRRPLP
jgi:large subunit ribosomal protein L13